MVLTEARSTCCYCGVGCGVIIETDGTRIAGVRGDPDHPANFGRLCTKGATLHLAAQEQATRARYPELRRTRAAARERVSWDAALDHAAERFAQIIRSHGPDSVAFYISGQLLTEDYYVFNKLARGLVGTNNIDSNSRLCMSSAVVGYKATLGVDAPPACYEDIDYAACIFIAGSNTAFAHPVLFRRIEDARRRNPALKLIVVDPRRTDTAQCADLHLPILPGTDVALFHGMLHVLLWEGLIDAGYIAAHTHGFVALKQIVREYTPETVAGLCGVPADDIIQAARWFGQSGATLSFYCQGLNQSAHGVDKNAALINLHLATGQIGRPGAGPFSLTGQPNAMGGRETGAMATLLPGHRDIDDPQHRAEVARLWGIPDFPQRPGLTAVELFDALRAGRVKAVWIACTNPVQSLPDVARVREALAGAEFVVLQEAYRNTETADYADLLLPAATWGEKEGTVTNSERRVSHVRAAVPPPDEARPDWAIACDFARRLASRIGRPERIRLFEFERVEQIFDEHRETTRGRDLDITGLSYALLDRAGPQQWPFPEGAAEGCARLYEDGVFATVDGRARFAAVRYQPVAERTDARYPFHLTTGRLRDQWHAMSRTGTVARLFNHVEEPALAMHRDDMERLRIRHGDLVRVVSRRGELVIRAETCDEMRPAQVYLPMHWGGRYLAGDGINALTLPVIDAQSKQPELKHAAVKVERIHLPWQMVLLRCGEAVARMAAIQPLLARFRYGRCGLYGRERTVLVVHLAHDAVPPPDWLADIDRRAGLDEDAVAMTYSDPKRGVSKRVLVDGQEIVAVRLVGEIAARDWLKERMARGGSIEAVRRWVMAPLAVAPTGTHRGRIVCSCHDVAETEIHAELAQGADQAALQAKLKCGTQCGSCVPELKRMVAAHAARARSAA